ncbi:alpha/beta fold hydrolase [Amycolatopsis sp. VC5-11]|uniref:alpha/beta fold hydrolase n=1 Tax=Amycolatopsis sp. VC5-11 TaxID=3120156 RepID=UPI0030096B73
MPDPIEPFLSFPPEPVPVHASRLQLVGGGSNLLVVPDSVDPSSSWLPVAEALVHHRVWLLGRSDPHDHEIRTTDTLADTVAHAVASLGGRPAVLGHGTGAVAVLQALIAQPDLPASRAILYEPLLPVTGRLFDRLTPEILDAIDNRDLERAIRLYLDHVIPMPQHRADRMVALSSLQSLVPALVPELRQVDHLLWTAADAARITVPVLLLLGELSPAHPAGTASAALAEAIPDVRTQLLPGQRHFVSAAAAPDIAGRIDRFLTEPPRPASAAAA